MSAQPETETPEFPWHARSAEDVAAELTSDAEQGLSPDEAARRLAEIGPNAIEGQKGKSALMRFLGEFNQPLIYILLVAGGVALLLQDWVDAGVILAVTVINATIGFVQASKAENAIAALARTLSAEATVIRGGQEMQVDARDLVPGDLVVVGSGDKIPADLRLVRVRDLQVSEASLTGESVPVLKHLDPVDEGAGIGDRTSMAFAGGLATYGRGRGIVVATGIRTETGRISRMMEAHEGLETPLTRKIRRFSHRLLFVILGLAALAFAAVLLKGGAWIEGFKAAVALAVAAIPEGLPAVVTVTLAIGVHRMARRHAIIRNLPAVETLGSTTVICSDKTGTLTENQMTVQAVVAGGRRWEITGVGYGGEGEVRGEDGAAGPDQEPALRACLVCGLLCNDSRLERREGRLEVVGDPTEGALLVSGRKAALDREALEKAAPRIDALPFESEHQYMATLHPDPDGEGTVAWVKGSLDALLARSSRMMDADGGETDLDGEGLDAANHALARDGMRVLAFATKRFSASQERLDHGDLEEGLTLIGLQGMIDPPRAEAVAAVAECRKAGIRVKMITGDHPETAAAIARQIGIVEGDEPRVHTGREVADMEGETLAEAARECHVFARVAPEQKLRLVEALQKQGEIAAMTGDGVNDAPALKQADIGIAMGITGTEVAQEASDMVLTDDNFASIEAAVEEGRTVFRNLLKTIAFILPVNGGESMTILAGILFAAAIPILPVQILWVNMVSSVALSATLAFEPKSRRTMEAPPRDPGLPLLSGPILSRVLAVSAYNVVAAFGMFMWVLRGTGDETLARTMAVQALVAAETFYLLCLSRCVPSLLARLRGGTEAVAWIPLVGVAAVAVLQFLFSQVGILNRLFHTMPLTGGQALLCLALGLPVLVPALLANRFARFE